MARVWWTLWLMMLPEQCLALTWRCQGHWAESSRPAVTCAPHRQQLSQHQLGHFRLHYWKWTNTFVAGRTP